MSASRWLRLALVAAALANLPCCGYALVGRGITTDATIKRIGVPTFRDTTGKQNLDQLLTRKVIEELLRRGRFDVVQQATGVDALVDGEIVSYNATPVGFEEGQATSAAQTTASRYAVTVTAKVKYVKLGSPVPLWANDSFSFRDEYDIGTDAAAFLDQEGPALDRLAQAFARSLVSAMLEAF